MLNIKYKLRSASIARAIALFCALLCVAIASAQVTGLQYNTTYSGTSINHKAAKWYSLRDASKTYHDTFDYDESYKMTTLADGTEIQTTHTVVDTIYMYRGTSTTLKIYDVNSGVSSGTSSSINNRTYQRWFNYEDDGLFECNIDSTYTTTTGGPPGRPGQSTSTTVYIYDLLTPTEPTTTSGRQTTTNFYKFANGYVGNPVSTSYNFYSAEFYFPSKAQQQKYGEVKSEYIVACDLSGYNDFTATFSENDDATTLTDNYCEPTLSHRYVYHIIAMDDVTPQYSDMHITLPATRYLCNTSEMVSLPLDARSYVGNSSDNVTITIGSVNTADISLLDDNNGGETNYYTLNGDDRIIFFKYPIDNGDGTRSVRNKDSKPEAQLLVKKGGTDGTTLMTFYLTFDEEARLLSQSQMNKIQAINNGTQTATGVLSEYTHRDPGYISENLELLTELNFDYDASEGATYGQTQYYSFPMGWEDMTAGFYDGSSINVTGLGNGFTVPSQSCPSWGYYGISTSYVETDSEAWNSDSGTPTPVDSDSIRFNSDGQQSTFHLYVDASNRPERFARLPFDQDLCGGTELYVTAWVKCAIWTRKGTGPANAGVMFSIMGVTEENGIKTYTPVYRYQTGQIPYTCATTDNNTSITCEGYDNSRNDWMQVYFSFINTTNEEYDSYVLEIDNASASANGADIYIDDVRIYIAKPSAVIKQLNVSCSSEATLMSVELDWERLTSRLGVDVDNASSNSYSGFNYCFIDKEVYDTYVREHEALEDNVYANAIAAAAVSFSDGPNDETDSLYYKYNSFYFWHVFTDNTEYDEENHPQLARYNRVDGKDYLYRVEDEYGVKTLTADFYGMFSINKVYWLIIEENTGVEPSAASFAQDIESPCAIKTSFYVTSDFAVRVNGEVVNPEVEYCKGQVLNFSVQVQVPTGTDGEGLETYTVVSDGIYFDWFLGTEDEYIAADSTYGDVSLREALVALRDIEQYQYIESLDGVTAGEYTGIDGNAISLTQDKIDIIQHYIDEPDSCYGQTGRLILCKKSLNIIILAYDVMNIVAQPIPMLISPDETIDQEYWKKVCWSYVPVQLAVGGESPILHAGFSEVEYPNENFNPCFRIGLDQINSTNASNTLTANLRPATFTTITGETISHLGLISDGAYDKLFLIETDDPQYDAFFPSDLSAFDMYSLPIGYITSLYAIEDDVEANVVTFYFDTETENDNGFKFTPREGYTYTFAINFQEYTDGGDHSGTCYGMIYVPMKVVPKYLVWQGTDDAANWNKDANWKRADAEDLLKSSDDPYLTNADNATDNGFVPMLFSNVVMPADSRSRLYMGGFSYGTTSVWTEALPDGMEKATENVQYDLMVYEDNGALTTKPYRVNLCDSIHFERGAQMMHAEQLLYSYASMDIPVVNNKWVAISTPLKDIVAGDWYTQGSGTQATEYFKDITFTDDYSRLNPAVFQRSWGDAATILKSSAAATGDVVSFSANWSAAYNDAAVAYNAGAGYSIRGWQSGTASLLFRMPKADTSYDYSTAAFSRDNNGKLLASGLVDRSEPEKDYSEASYAQDPVTVTLTAANGDGSYLMVGNPYMAAVDVQAFMEGNSTALAQKYWYVDSSTGALNAVNCADGVWSEGATCIGPYAVFYVEAADEDATSVDVLFTADMQAIATSGATAAKAARVMVITAADESGTSVATVGCSTAASNGYDRLEDAELLSGLGESGGVRVFTAADNTAISANQLKDMTCIPLGICTGGDEAVTVTFDNVEAIDDASLYDAETLTTTPLYDGYALQLTGSSYGRYFLKGAATATSISGISADSGVHVSSLLRRQVVVTSDAAIKEVSVWSASGVLLKRQQVNGDNTCTLNGVESGMAVVKVTTIAGTTSKKLMIR